MHSGISILGAVMNGENAMGMTFSSKGVLVLGSEAHGISQRVQQLLTKRITIPRFGKAESLNVASAAAILCNALKQG